MIIIFMTLALSIVLSLVFLIVFVWTTRKGQYDDLKTPSYRMLIDDYEQKTETSTTDKEEKDK